MLSPETDPVQVVSLIVVIATITVLVQGMRKHPQKRLWYAPVLFWMIHAAIFYVVLFIDRGSDLPVGISYTEWSPILRLHGYLTMLSIEYFRLKKPVYKRESK